MFPPYLSASIEGSFAYLTVRDRLPVIITKIIDHLCREKLNLKDKYGKDCLEDIKFIVGGLSHLKNHIQTNKSIDGITELQQKPNDDEFWRNAFQLYREFHQKDPQWFNSSWLFVEVFMYRRVHELFDQSVTLKNYDPFQHEKINCFESASDVTASLLEYTLKENINNPDADTRRGNFLKFCQISLWGNQYDLSLSSCADKAQGVDLLSVLDEKKKNILSWDIEEAFSFLETKREKEEATIGIVLDNAGFELVSDLCFASFLLESGYCSKIHLYTKTRPYYVSDTMKPDIDYVLNLLGSGSSVAGKRISSIWSKYLSEGSFVVKERHFWTAPHDYSQMKEEDPCLYEELASTDLLIFKGDLNYRKLVGDLDWPVDTPFLRALRGFRPAPLLVLRTIKGGPVVGMDPESIVVKSAFKSPDWNCSGDFGMTHFLGL